MKFLLFTLLPFYLLSFLPSNLLHASDMKVKLNSTDGSTAFQIRDSNDVVVSSITSDGNIHTKYGVRTSTITLTGGSGNIFSTVTGPADNITLSSHTKVLGQLIVIGSVTVLGELSATTAGTYSIITSSGIKMGAGVLDIPEGAIKDGTITTTDVADRQVSSAKLLVTSTYTYQTGPWNTTANTWSTLGGLTGTLSVTTAPATIFLYFDASTVWRSETSQWTKVGFRFNVGGTSVGYAEAYTETSGGAARQSVGLNAIYRVTTTGNYTVSVEWRSGDDGAAWGTANCANASFSAFWVGSP